MTVERAGTDCFVPGHVSGSHHIYVSFSRGDLTDCLRADSQGEQVDSREAAMGVKCFWPAKVKFQLKIHLRGRV